jgi:hypothetical protein
MRTVDRFSSQHIPAIQSAVGVFDADCKNINRIPLNNVIQTTPRLLDYAKPSVQRRMGSASPSGPLSCGVPPAGPPSVKYQVPPFVVAEVEPTSNTCQITLLRWGTVPLLYLSAMTAGLSVLGIFGGAVSVTRTLLSISLFQSVLTPVTVVHCILSIDNKFAVGMGLVALVYTSISVPLSLIFNTLTFASISFVILAVFHVVAGVHGWACVLHLPIIGTFIWFCVGGFPNNPDRGDTIGLIMIPCTQILFVCVSGVLSTMWKPGEKNNPEVI